MRAGYVAERRVLFAEGRGTRISPPTHAQRVRMNGAPGETLRLRSVQALEHPAEAGRKAATKGNIGHSSMKKVIDHDLARPNEKWLARICFQKTEAMAATSSTISRFMPTKSATVIWSQRGMSTGACSLRESWRGVD